MRGASRRQETARQVSKQVSVDTRNEVGRRLAAIGYADGFGTEMSYADANSAQIRIALYRMKQLGYTDEQVNEFIIQTLRGVQEP